MTEQAAAPDTLSDAERQHTPTPWSRDPIVYQSGCERTIYLKSEATGRTVGILSCITPNDYTNNFKADIEREAELVATAEFILRAANGYDELLAALELAEAEITFLLNISGREGGRTLERIRAAIAAAR